MVAISDLTHFEEIDDKRGHVQRNLPKANKTVPNVIFLNQNYQSCTDGPLEDVCQVASVMESILIWLNWVVWLWWVPTNIDYCFVLVWVDFWWFRNRIIFRGLNWMIKGVVWNNHRFWLWMIRSYDGCLRVLFWRQHNLISLLIILQIDVKVLYEECT